MTVSDTKKHVKFKKSIDTRQMNASSCIDLNQDPYSDINPIEISVQED